MSHSLLDPLPSGSDESLTVLVKGDNVFGTTVSKSFAVANERGGPIEGVDTVNISVASYRVIEVSRPCSICVMLRWRVR